jgi:hypothetical protein
MHAGLKILAGSAVLLLLSLGLCGMGHLNHSLTTLGFGGFLLSVVGIVLGIIVAIIEAIVSVARSREK